MFATTIAGMLLLQVGATAIPRIATRAGDAGAVDEFARVRATIRNVMARDSIPALAIAVVRNGAIVWEEGFGFSDASRAVPATAHTSFYLASVTKTITATAIMALAERDRLNIDRPANAYLPPRRRLTSPGPWAASSATVRHLLQHSSGLSTFSWSCYDDQPGCRVLDPDSLIGRYGVLMYPPGEHFDYTNLGFSVLGEIVAHVSGQPFKAALRDILFAPLGMADASMEVDSTRLGSTAVRVSRARGPHMTVITGSPGASSGYASAHDLARFAMLHLGQLDGTQRVLSPRTIGRMQRETVATDNPETEYGLGWWIYPDQHGTRIVSASGGTDDSYASVRLVPSEKLGVVLLANIGTTVLGDVIESVYDELLPGYRDRRIADSVAAAKAPSRVATAPGVPRSLVGAWKGSVATAHGPVTLDLAVDASGSVRAALGSGSERELTRVSFTQLVQGVPQLSGRLTGDLGVPEDVGPAPYPVYVEVYLRDGRLLGLATSYPAADAPYGARLTFPVALTRK